MRLGERADWKHKIRCYCHDDADSRGWSIHRWSRLATSSVTIDGSKFKAVNNRDRNYTEHKAAKRIEQVEASIERYLAALDRADREGSDVPRG